MRATYETNNMRAINCIYTKIAAVSLLMCKYARLPRGWLCAAIALQSQRNALLTNAVLCFLCQLLSHCVGRMIPLSCNESRVNTSDALEIISYEY